MIRVWLVLYLINFKIKIFVFFLNKSNMIKSFLLTFFSWFNL